MEIRQNFCATKLGQEFENPYSWGNDLFIISSGTGRPGEVKELLNLAVEQTGVYEVWYRPDGTAILHDGKPCWIKDHDYYEWIVDATQFSCRYVS